MISMKVNDTEVRDQLKRLSINVRKYGRVITRKYAELLVKNLKKGAPRVTGTLRKSIENKSSRGGWGQDIHSAHYADYVDTGALPSKGGRFMPINKASLYAKKYGIKNMTAWRRHIAEYGTRPHPFLLKAVYSTEANAKSKIYNRYVRRMVR